ncbi:MAG: hypothetical protein L3J82_10690, partial [Planctomycetes bacterium]|nr:hypothetical protein [Planctomycetota bacterium]
SHQRNISIGKTHKAGKKSNRYKTDSVQNFLPNLKLSITLKPETEYLLPKAMYSIATPWNSRSL